MYFIGQKAIMNQLKDILPYLYETGSGMAFLLRGPSGWGKTRMSFMICNYLSGGSFSYSLGDKPIIDSQFRVHFIDEVHLLKNPEFLYPIIDSKKYVMVFATNDVAIVPEALSNRCVNLVFDKYTNPELREICRSYSKEIFSNDILDYIIDSGADNPRIIKGIIDRLSIISIRKPGYFDGMDLPTFKSVLESLMGISDGMDVLCNRYLEFLSKIGGTASIQTISTSIHVDQNTLKFYVEPILLHKNKIRITSKGRTLV